MNEVERSTQLWSDGVKMIGEYLDMRWDGSQTMTQSEANVAVKLIGANKTPSHPWRVFSGYSVDVFHQIQTSLAHILLIIREPQSAMVIYAPPCLAMRTEGLFTSRPCLVAHILDGQHRVFPMHLVICHMTYRPSELCLTVRDPSSAQWDILVVTFGSDMAYTFKRRHVLSELCGHEISKTLTVEWFVG